MIHGHGNEIFNSPIKIKADFSSNVWYKGTSDELVKMLSSNIKNIYNYPEPDSYSLRYKIAGYFDLNADNIIVTNGSTEAFYLVAQVFSNYKSIIVTPSFSEYYDACRLYNHQITKVLNTSDWHRTSYINKIIWFANPNNPDGKTTDLSDIEEILKNNSSSIFILDEAYIELCFSAETAISLLNKYSNLVIIRSFTKAFSIPGLRLGYIIASKVITDMVRKFIMPWNVNSMALTAGLFIMDNYDNLLPDKMIIKLESEKLQQKLMTIKELKVYPSCCNFFLIELISKEAKELKSYLLNEYGMLIRDASNFNIPGNSYCRIALQTPKMNKILVEGIKNWMQL